jgi:hypothetical protein
MPPGIAILEKLRALITHDGTPASERRAALDRLERLVRGHDGPSTIATRITRSTRIGRQRRMLPVDERDRLAGYTEGLSLADFIARIARACGQQGRLPEQIDFGCYGSDRPVIAVRFSVDAAPQAVDFAASIGEALPGTRVNLANRSGPEERLFLLYPPGKAIGVEAAA